MSWSDEEVRIIIRAVDHLLSHFDETTPMQSTQTIKNFSGGLRDLFSGYLKAEGVEKAQFRNAVKTLATEILQMPLKVSHLRLVRAVNRPKTRT